MSSTGETKLYGFLVIVIILAGGAIAAIVLFNPGPTGPAVNVIGSDDSSSTVYLNDMLAMETINRNGSFQNSYGNVRGTGIYEGVKVSVLIERVGGMDGDEVVIINATDGYSQTFTYQNVYPNSTIYGYQGDMVLAYSYNGTQVPDWEQGFRLMFLPEDEYFSNVDADMVMDPQFFAGAAGPMSVSNVASIRVMERPETPILDVTVGGETTSFTMNELQSMAAVTGLGGFKNKFGTLVGPDIYTGVSIYDLFDSLGTIPTSYNVYAIASDGWSSTYEQSLIEGTAKGYNSTTGDSVGLIDCDMILAYFENGEPIVDDGPLRVAIVNDDGYLTDSFYWAKFVVNLTIEATVLNVTMGEKGQSYTMSDLMDMPAVIGNGGYKKSSGTLVGPLNYTGVSLEKLLGEFSEVPVNYTLEAIADDGYKTYFNTTHVEIGTFAAYNGTTGDPVAAKNFTLTLAYAVEGNPLSDGGPLRIVALNEDGYFTDGHWWAKYVVSLNIIDSTDPWKLKLDGVEKWNMTHDTYYSLASCAHHRTNLALGDDYFEGVPLYVIVAAMDGADDEHYLFNTTLLSTNYNVTLYDSIGNNITYNCWSVTQNMSILVAGWVNGALLDEPDWPLKLVTPEGITLGDLVKVEMIGWDT